jgi:hypothetical protein
MSAQNTPEGLNADEWAEKLRDIAGHLKHPASLCLIGAAPGMFSAQPRSSMDLDVWDEGSTFFHSDLKQAVEKAGLLFDPKSELAPEIPYIQIVQPGIVHLGDYKETQTLLREPGMTVVCPPIENIIASKLLRAGPKDIEDIIYLRRRFSVSRERVEKIIETFPAGVIRETARENIVYLEIAPPQNEAGHDTPAPSPRAPGDWQNPRSR